ncbi:hypothetical protein Sjap_004614 [Stephania japonica]|uniref:Uncharacterized protein n=1 Tax=Stephania japonica TaxID=461633 RepID=A0AAP0K2T4_9MAGN
MGHYNTMLYQSLFLAVELHTVNSYFLSQLVQNSTSVGLLTALPPSIKKSSPYFTAYT